MRITTTTHSGKPREARNRQAELSRQLKALGKLSVLEQSRLEVEEYENTLDLLLSLHKEQSELIDWLSMAINLPPIPPCRQKNNEFKTRQRIAILAGCINSDIIIDQSIKQDDQEHEEQILAYNIAYENWAKMARLARRILKSDPTAYIDAIETINPFEELANIGSSFHFSSHNSQLVEVTLSTHGKQIIPENQKTLTTSGKVSVKPIPKSRFIELYQDYICSCVLRVARELFALLPIETILISASVETFDTSTGQSTERPILSVAISRTTIHSINFDMIDPSDAIMKMPHRGELKASRKTGDFEIITPLTVDDLNPQDTFTMRDFTAKLETTRQLRAELATQCLTLTPELP
jgi:hypothetical protein